MRVLVSTVVLVALLLSPAALAAQGLGQLEAAAQVPLWGSLHVGPAEGQLVVLADEAGGFALRAPFLTVTTLTNHGNGTQSREVVNFTNAVVTLLPGSEAILPSSQDPSTQAAWAFTLADARAPPQDVQAADANLGAPTALLMAGDLFPAKDPSGTAMPAASDAWALMPLVPGQLAGALRLHLALGGTLHVVGAEGERDFTSDVHEETIQQGGVGVPVVGSVGGGETRSRATNLTVLAAPDAVADLPPNAPGRSGSTAYVARGLRINVQGTAFLQDAVGKITIAGQDYTADHEDVVLGGAFELLPHAWQQGGSRTPWTAAPSRAPPSAPRSSFGIQGDITFVRIAESPGQSFAPIAVAGAGLVGLAALIAFVPAFKFGVLQLLVAPLYTRLKKPEVLEQKRREQLLESIRAEPGANATELANKLGIGWGNLVYHLGVLERERLVSSVREGRHRRFFPVGMVDHRYQQPLALLKNVSAARVMDIIRAQPGLPQKSLSRQAGLSPSTINWHVERLSEAGLVWRRQEGREVQYFPSDLLHEIDPGEPSAAA